MAFDPTNIFNKAIEGDVLAELQRRERLVAGITRDEDFKKWNYKKYCYVSATGTGVNKSKTICAGTMTIGDGSINEQAGLDLYEDEGGIRRNLPILKSVDFQSDGGQNIEDATLWTVKVEFDVFTIDQLNRAEAAFMRIQNEVKIDFGWRGESSSANSGTLTGTVFNFGFSANQDGSFSCNFDMVGENKLFAGESLEGVPDVTTEDVANDTDEQVALPGLIDSINKRHKKNFAIASGEEFTADNAAAGTITLAPSDSNYALANVPAAATPGLLSFLSSDTEDLFVPYVTLGELVRQTNELMKDEAGESAYTIKCDSTTTIGHYAANLFSADPVEILLGGDMANYGVGTDAGNEMKFGDTLNEFQGDNADLSKIYLAIPLLTRLFNEAKTENKKGSTSTAPNTKNYFRKVFEKIEKLTGGLYQLVWYQDVEAGGDIAYIVNKRPGYGGGNIDGTFPFKVLGETSIIRGMSLNSVMDAEIAMAANSSARSGGTVDIPESMWSSLYSDCDKSPNPVEKTKVTDDQLAAQKKSYGEGYDASIVEASEEILKRYIVQNQTSIGDEFKSAPTQFELSITLDGIWGIPFYSRFTVDRLPQSYGDNLFFKTTALGHKFDGQGGWQTDITGVMQVRL
jgi:hypothetical protein